MVYTGSILYKNVLSPFYDKLVLIFPPSVHPNTITLIGGIFAVLSNFAMISDYRWSACILFTLYHMFDNMDGKHARRTKQTSEFGAMLDHLVDGTAGIWSGGLTFAYVAKVSGWDIAYGVWAFTCLFWAVHVVHALTGFFELGNDYLSIDEAFVILSVLRAIYALDVALPSFIYNRTTHWFLICFVLASAVHWLATHGRSKIQMKTLKAHLPMVGLFFAYVVFAHMYLLSTPEPSMVTILAVWAFPYTWVLYESRNKH